MIHPYASNSQFVLLISAPALMGNSSPDITQGETAEACPLTTNFPFLWLSFSVTLPFAFF
jgi:hypothetical protein